MATDIRDEIFKNIIDKKFSAMVTAEGSGIIAGIDAAVKLAEELGLQIDYCLQDGSPIIAGEKVLLLRGTPKQIAQAEEVIIGTMSMASGIATAAKYAAEKAGEKVRVVAGAWKKMPPAVKDLVRAAILSGGGKFRITDLPFVYLDKNYVRLLGGIQEALAAVESLEDMCKCIQLKGESLDIVHEAELAARNGADIIMIDTGVVQHVEQVVAHLQELGLRDEVKVAFGNGVKLQDIAMLAAKGFDILDIGLQIIDAPLLDMKLDVLKLEKNKTGMLEANLFEKTELWIRDIYLQAANLNEIADAIAEVLNLNKQEVLVIDVQDTAISLDILKTKINLTDIAGKEKELLSRLKQIKHVEIGTNCTIHAEGILGVITMDKAFVDRALGASYDMSADMNAKIASRVKVFPTGFEIIRGYIEDTNSLMIKERLEAAGFKVSIGNALDDDIKIIQRAIRAAIDDGYGLIITTGGTGAESKDCTVEAVLSIDKQAATPYIVKFQKGCGRHVKNGVRIAVGRVDNCWIISLPGPNAEVQIAMETIISVLNTCNKYELAEHIAKNLRAALQDKNKH